MANKKKDRELHKLVIRYRSNRYRIQLKKSEQRKANKLDIVLRKYILSRGLLVNPFLLPNFSEMMRTSLANKESRLLGLKSHVKCLKASVAKLDDKLSSQRYDLRRLCQIGTDILKNPLPTTENVNRIFFHLNQFDIKIK